MRAASGTADRIEGHRKSLPADSVVQLIERHARQTPSRVALEHCERPISYGNLLAHAQTVAWTLLEQGVEPGETVAIWAHRRPAVVAAMLGTLAARASYTPIDPTYPDDRVKAILGTARPVALLYDGGSDPPSSYADVTAIDIARTSLSAQTSLSASMRSLPLPRGGDTAYIVFTSGSTGSPKGVVVDHQSLLNYVCWCAAMVGPDGRGAPLFASLGFDHAMTCLWVPLAQGKRVSLAELWQAESIFGPYTDRYTFLKLTPSHGRFFERMLQPNYGNVTRVVMFGGEALSWQLLDQLDERLAHARIVNHYGPSEATVGCCWHELKPAERRDTPTVPIGKPIWNSHAYVVDDDLCPVAAGQEGELVMGGLCLARGYLGSDDERRAFVAGETVANGEAGKLYRTGDFVRQLDDGALLYLGRRDNQVKIRGHRLELGELRVHVTAVPTVADVAFDVVHDELDRIELFVVPADDAHDAHDELVRSLRTALGKTLPRHLIPEKIHIVNQLVFNAHGKCDLASTRQLAELEGVSV